MRITRSLFRQVPAFRRVRWCKCLDIRRVRITFDTDGRTDGQAGAVRCGRFNAAQTVPTLNIYQLPSHDVTHNAVPSPPPTRFIRKYITIGRPL